MKKFVRQFFLVFLVMVTVIASLSGQTAGDTAQTVSKLQWIVDHWELVALVVSEVLAFLPSKVSGIVQGIVTSIGNIVSFFQKRK